MDWARPIAINQTALTRIVAALIAMVGIVGGGVARRLGRPTYRAVLRVLRPAEAAARRLIVVMAWGMAVKALPVRARLKGRKPAGKGGGRGGRQSFQLFDPRQRFAQWRPKPMSENRRPRVWLVGDERPPGTLVFRPEDFGKPVPAPKTDDSVDTARLGRRLAAIKQALEDLPAQAKRLARWRAKRERMADPEFISPLRPGRPPGYRQRPRDEVDWILKDCHALARAVEAEDTS